MKKKAESRSKQVQLVQRKSLADSVRFKAQSEHVSINEVANHAITDYIQSGGDNIVADNNCRMVLMMQPSQYNLLAEMAKAQGISVNKAIEHALEAYVTGKQTDNTMNRLLVYITRTAKLGGKVRNIVSTVNESYGGMADMMKDINEMREKKVPKSREKEKYEEILVEVDKLWSKLEKMVDTVNEIHLESEFDD